eukprot:TRINITY_DN1106_c3_g1_i1.p1 TRINITY_DN1106_c3_g1~~TRINITY_DN1106_c3_g1_i1.p1  ORF type:complete len:133 (-),score=57.54 TRINITY_DN1106_c3_g1_i1:155-553(-)
MASDEPTLPKATIGKLIKEALPSDMRCSDESRDAIVDCCVEFIHMISSEANEICNKENKRTITPEHILDALKSLDFNHYLPEVQAIFEQHKFEFANRPRGIKSVSVPHDYIPNNSNNPNSTNNLNNPNNQQQ